jgi:hypothetical protein
MDRPVSDWSTLVARFDALGDAAQEALARTAIPLDGSTPRDDAAPSERGRSADEQRLTELLAERDALLAQLTAAVAGHDDARLAPALERSVAQTGDLIQRVAERTDALRDALRALQRGAHVHQAYRQASPTGGWAVIDARR